MDLSPAGANLVLGDVLSAHNCVRGCDGADLAVSHGDVHEVAFNFSPTGSFKVVPVDSGSEVGVSVRGDGPHLAVNTDGEINECELAVFTRGPTDLFQATNFLLLLLAGDALEPVDLSTAPLRVGSFEDPDLAVLAARNDGELL